MLEVFKYVDLPKIPINLISDITEIQKQKNIYKLDVEFYKQFEVSKELYEFLETLFPFKFSAQYQIIKKEIPIHKDKSRVECFNYLIDNGGSDTRLDLFFDDKKTLITSVHVENFKWHWINVSKFHVVSGLNDAPRLGITVTPFEKKL